MKKILVLFVLASFCAASVDAQQDKKAAKPEKQAVADKKLQNKNAVQSNDPADYDFLEIMLFPGFPSYSETSIVRGIKIGLPVSGGQGKVSGLEMAAACSLTDTVSGVQAAPLFTLAENIDGAQFSSVNVTTGKCAGAQFGAVNYSEKDGMQFGLVNIMKNGFLPFFPIVNFPVSGDKK